MITPLTRPTNRIVLGFACVLLFTAAAPTGFAAPFYLQTASHVDGGGNAYISWEAETFNSTTTRTVTTGISTWGIFNDPSASNLQALLADDGNLGSSSGTTNPSGSSSNIVTYDLKFVTPGTYSLYWRGRAGTTGDGIGGGVSNNDGWFAPGGGFGDEVPAVQVNGFNISDLVRLGGPVSGDNYTTSYQWFRQGGTLNPMISFVVTPDNVLNGDLLSISMGTREDGLLIDRWLLSTNNSLFSSSAGNSNAAMNAFSTAEFIVPEPGALALWLVSAVGLFMFTQTLWRKRRSALAKSNHVTSRHEKLIQPISE